MILQPVKEGPIVPLKPKALTKYTVVLPLYLKRRMKKDLFYHHFTGPMSSQVGAKLLKETSRNNISKITTLEHMIKILFCSLAKNATA